MQRAFASQNTADLADDEPVGKDRMHNDNAVQRFLELRAPGWTYLLLLSKTGGDRPMAPLYLGQPKIR